MQNYIDTFIEKGIPNLITALGILIVSIYFARVLGRVVGRVLKAREAPEGVSQLLTQLVFLLKQIFFKLAYCCFHTFSRF